MASNPPPALKIEASTDQRWMRVAIAAARRAEGRSGPNPPVGCAIVSPQNQLLGVGHTASGGRPHAETVALARVPAKARFGATAYVTLEPCAHVGQTGPCASALIAAGIKRVVIAVQDPDNRVNGAGITLLQQAGVSVDVGVCAQSATRVMAGFLTRAALKRPFVSWKTATSLDGMIALSDGQKRWLTGPDMRRFVHLLRSRADAVLSAIGTVLADDPALTCRNKGLSADSPRRFILDGHLRTPMDSILVQTANEIPVTLFCGADVPSERQSEMSAAGVTVTPLPLDDCGRPDLLAALRAIAAVGCNHVFVEAGARLAQSLMQRDLIDRIIWTQSMQVIGGDGIPAISGMSLLALPAQTRYMQDNAGMFGEDRWTILERRQI